MDSSVVPTRMADQRNIIMLRSGNRWDLTHPEDSKFEISDIAYGLAGEGRFANQVEPRITVAEHSVNVSIYLERKHPDLKEKWHLAWEGLFHDAPEAIIGDMIRDLKAQCKDYRDIEWRHTKTIMPRLKCSAFMDARVHEADRAVLHAEMAAVEPYKSMCDHPRTAEWCPPVRGLEPREAYTLFMDRVDYLRERMEGYHG